MKTNLTSLWEQSAQGQSLTTRLQLKLQMVANSTTFSWSLGKKTCQKQLQLRNIS